MSWTGIARQEHNRKGLRYPSDLTDREWLLTAPFIPLAKSGRSQADQRHARGIERGALYRLEWLCVADATQMLSAGLNRAPLFLCLAQYRIVRTINTVLVMNLREIEGREASPVPE